jgi:hypothetical protein
MPFLHKSRPDTFTQVLSSYYIFIQTINKLCYNFSTQQENNKSGHFRNILLHTYCIRHDSPPILHLALVPYTVILYIYL